VVLVHGAGPQTRRDFHFFRWLLAHQGVVVLAYDKRGVGGSAGDWTTASFEDLARDALAGVRLLRQRPEVDPARVGVLGWSNGAWVAPLAASMAPGEVGFVIAGAASGVSNGENIAFEVRSDLRGAGLAPDQVERGVALRREVTRFVLEHPEPGAAAWDTLRARVAAERGEPWFPFARVGWVLGMAPPPDSATVRTLGGFRRQWSLDPLPAWEQVRVPTLVLLGEMDNAVPAAESALKLRAALARAGNRGATVRLYPGASHALYRVASPSQKAVMAAVRYVPGYPRLLADWIRRLPGGAPSR
jgi:hypothetical protein